MTQVTAGRIRYVLRDAALREVAIGPEFDPTVLDNTAAPRYFLNGGGNVNDDPEYFIDEKTGKPIVFSGKADEILEVQYYDSAAVTLDTSDMTDWAIGGRKAIRQKDGSVLTIPETLRLRHRITQDTTANAHPRGLNDDGVTVANVWSPILRFGFRAGESFQPSGRQTGSIHNSS